MVTAAAQHIVEIWEELVGVSGARRTHALLAIANPAIPGEELWHWTLGRCNERLLTMHESLFGGNLTSVAECPKCQRRIEAEFASQEIRRICGGTQSALENAASGAVTRIPCGEGEARVRAPNLGDIAALDRLQDSKAFVSELVKRCVQHAAVLPAAVDQTAAKLQLLPQLEKLIAEQDPWADIYTEMDCSYCGVSWTVIFDISAYLSEKIEYWAQRLLDEVHSLALRYHWSQTEILAMSPTRRQFYLQRGTA